MKRTTKLSIQSISDLITNSSSEVFIMTSDNIDEDIQYICEFAQEHEFRGSWEEQESIRKNGYEKQFDFCGGLGGEIQISSNEKNLVKNWNFDAEEVDDKMEPNLVHIYKDDITENGYNIDNVIMIDIDNKRYATIQMLKDEFNTKILY